jgi:sRNA-binding carbon storage regulator CsrA
MAKKKKKILKEEIKKEIKKEEVKTIVTSDSHVQYVAARPKTPINNRMR